MKDKKSGIIKSIIKIVTTSFSIVLISHLFLFMGIVVGSSMDDTLHDTNFVYGVNYSHLPIKINHGNVIAVKKEIYEKEYIIIKRVIGLPGDIIKIEDKEIYLNGEKLVEKYIKEEMIYNYQLKTYFLAKDEYFIMGDNRNDSMDSRDFGPVKKKDIISLNLIYRDNNKIKFIK